ncbi:ABC transporter ATP-binding protein [Clostridium sp. CF011]|uniref:ABC transporter ATP-binding protein n=1 Tax=unclassified Clostridium TaxID=2614128 RepID=UPI001C0E6540|nr:MULTISPECIES: ABC transporter ATP-binding protein [unclassified Clostridium]MBU3092639.1 ABC transporter ATP-binding protein [Clostridium sp. CF011]MBW9145319.1 ABC transporter ATP-binding protein [Clostridium sp. CM027]UVE42458.1 ABC transporter ATP-binding protein [Clostridium sp. CM027]WAG71477.1 ABC transporter ATP-binding protein [Clostridium sp. CF011]
MKLVLENISKQYKDKYAVKNLKVKLTPGVYGLLGPNGSGKTTLMRIMTDILNPTGGRVILNGEDIKVMGDRYRDILGYLPQNFGIYKDFTAHRFLMYISALKGLDTRSAQRKVDELLELVNLKAVSKKKLGTFSGGMKQRIGIAQALLNDPKILILDEPTTGLDPKERIRFRNLISDMSKDKIIIFSTHIVSDIEYISKEVLLLKNGELIEKDSIDNILKNMENKVWSAIVEENMLNELNKDFKVGNIMRKEKGIEVRIISDEKPLPKAKVEVPRLEDLYMYYFEEEQTDEQAI